MVCLSVDTCNKEQTVGIPPSYSIQHIISDIILFYYQNRLIGVNVVGMMKKRIWLWPLLSNVLAQCSVALARKSKATTPFAEAFA